MKLYQKLIAFSFLSITIISFQNCGKNFTNKPEDLVQASSVFVDMKSSEADAIFSTYSGSCVLNSKFQFQNVNPNSDVKLNGQQFAGLIYSNVPSISGSGTLLLKGSKAGFMVGQVASFTGKVALCDVSVDTISGSSNTTADVFIEGGTLNSVSGFSGNIIISGDRFPEDIKNFWGNIVVKTSGGQVLGRKYIK